MGKYYALFNPNAFGGKCEESAHRLDNISFDKELEYVDMTKIENLEKYIDSLNKDDSVILCGGDGTINYFINHVSKEEFDIEIMYFACGTGNDFLHDLSKDPGEHAIVINEYIRDLPLATVNGKTYKFINNVGFGIDGYCCQVGDEMRAAGKENINYTAIAIKGLLGGFKPVTATVTVDGITEVYKRAWLAPTMKGRFYGGGMMAAPAQNRRNPNKTVSVVLFYGKGKFKTLMAFPSIFQGEHVLHKDMVEIIQGNHVKVRFNRPCALQIDGETILNVTEYEVRTHYD